MEEGGRGPASLPHPQPSVGPETISGKFPKGPFQCLVRNPGVSEGHTDLPNTNIENHSVFKKKKSRASGFRSRDVRLSVFRTYKMSQWVGKTF